METAFEKIKRKSGRKESQCKCSQCRTQCTVAPCLGTPADIIKLIEAGYGNRLRATKWAAGVVVGVIDKPVNMIQAEYDNTKKACTFFRDGLCELHDKGLKPTEGRLSSHEIREDNFNFQKSLSWLVAQEWLRSNEFQELL